MASSKPTIGSSRRSFVSRASSTSTGLSQLSASPTSIVSSKKKGAGFTLSSANRLHLRAESYITSAQKFFFKFCAICRGYSKLCLSLHRPEVQDTLERVPLVPDQITTTFMPVNKGNHLHH